jgi:hypothetical protein
LALPVGLVALRNTWSKDWNVMSDVLKWASSEKVDDAEYNAGD